MTRAFISSILATSMAEGLAMSSSTTTQLYYETYGSGEPMIFLHGLGASIYTWRKVKEPLAASNKLFLVDLKGFGQSPKPRDDQYSIMDQADLVYQLIVEHDLKNLTLVGNSYGGAVSLMLAIKLCAENPNRLVKLILIDSAGYNKLIPWYVKVLRTPILGWLMVHLATNRTLAKTVLKESYYHDQLITAADIAAYAKPLGMKNGKYALIEVAQQAIPKNIDKWIARYPTICVPTLIIWGDHDVVIPSKIGEMLNTAIPCSKLTIIANTGHVPQEETPAPTVELIKDFLKNSIPCPP